MEDYFLMFVSPMGVTVISVFWDVTPSEGPAASIFRLEKGLRVKLETGFCRALVNTTSRRRKYFSIPVLANLYG
jgi:hypothetical protein